MPKTPKTKEYYLKKYEEAKELERRNAELHTQPRRDVEDNVKEISNSKPQTKCQLNDDVPELLKVIGEYHENEAVFGSNLHDNLVKLWIPILNNGLGYEVRKKLLDNYPVPNNCRLLAAPKLNPELSDLIRDYDNARDKRLFLSQNQLGHAVTAIGKALTLVLRKGDEVEIAKCLADGCRLLSDIHCDYTKIRSVLLKKNLEPRYLPFIERQIRDEFLFGVNLGDKIKSLQQASAQLEPNSRFEVDQQGFSRQSKPRFRHQNDLQSTSLPPEPKYLSHEVQSGLFEPKVRFQEDMLSISSLESSTPSSRSTGIYRNVKSTSSRLIGSQEVEPGTSDRRPCYQKDTSISRPSESRLQSNDFQPVLSEHIPHSEEDLPRPSGDTSTMSVPRVFSTPNSTRSRRSQIPARQRVLRP